MKKRVIVIVGCGGTGGYLIPALCNYLEVKERGLKEADRSSLVLIDGDTVEAKNLERQYFSEDDIGENKAISFEKRIAEAGLSANVFAYDRYLETPEELKAIADNYKGEKIFVGCVDNMHARNVIKRTFHMYDDAVYIDGGNEFKNGQCVYAAKNSGVIISPDYSFYFVENLEGEKSRTQMSCTELNSVSPQHVLANRVSAELILHGIVQLYEGVTPRGMSLFELAKGFSVKYETPEEYGFKIEESVGEYINTRTLEEKLDLIKDGKFLDYFSKQEDSRIREAVISFIQKEKEKNNGENNEKEPQQQLEAVM